MKERQGSSLRGLALLALAALALAAALPSSVGARAPTPRLGAEPGLIPRFDWDSSDYAIRCGSGRLRLRVQVPRGWEARIDGGAWREDSFKRRFPAVAGRGHELEVRTTDGGSRRRTFHTRCLPADFPQWGFQRHRPGGPALFSVNLGHFAIVFSGDGAPVWWYRSPATPIDAKVLADGSISWFTFQGTGEFEIRRPSGRLVRTLNSVSGETDAHDLVLLPNGNYLLGALVPRSGVDTSAYGGDANATVLDLGLEEVNPQGELVWSWNSADHIDLAETGRWWPAVVAAPIDGAYDQVHWNSVAVTKDALLISNRHLDAVYKINRDSGAIEWKLGGTDTPESLEVHGDPEGAYPLGAQHDARFAADGTISVFDNFTGLDPSPRVTRYRIDSGQGTATLVGSFSDPNVPSTFCCGSARLLAGGGWLTSWGGHPLIAAYRSGGKPVFTLTPKGEDVFSYRAQLVRPKQIRIGALRRGMDAPRRFHK